MVPWLTCCTANAWVAGLILSPTIIYFTVFRNGIQVQPKVPCIGAVQRSCKRTKDNSWIGASSVPCTILRTNKISTNVITWSYDK